MNYRPFQWCLCAILSSGITLTMALRIGVGTRAFLLGCLLLGLRAACWRVRLRAGVTRISEAIVPTLQVYMSARPRVGEMTVICICVSQTKGKYNYNN